jgi:cell fate (sporulation/competence/biofilm development) regulator YmcA (YheA/YmcA/DUF963 family)
MRKKSLMERKMMKMMTKMKMMEKMAVTQKELGKRENQKRAPENYGTKM